MDHPPLDPELLRTVAAGELPAGVLDRWCVQQGRRRCPGCRRNLNRLRGALLRWLRYDPAGRPLAWDAARLALLDPREACPDVYREAGHDLRHLRRLNAGERLPAVKRARVRFRSAAFVELAIAQGEEARRTAPREAVEWCAAAEEAAHWLTAFGYSEEVKAALGLRAAAHRANALRVAGDLPAAGTLWRKLATDPRRRRVIETELHAELASLEASLCTDQRRFARAAWLLARAAGWSRALGDRPGEAKVLIQRGYVAFLAGDPPAALALYRRAERALDPQTSPRLYLNVQENLVLVESELGRHREASRRLARLAPLYARFADPATLTLRAWLEGRVARGLGEHAEAARHLARARDAYLDQGLGLDASLVSLDLADLYLETGRTAEVKQLARAVEPVFRCQDVGREATAALVLFQRAARAERLTTAFVTRLRGFLDRTRRGTSKPESSAG